MDDLLIGLLNVLLYVVIAAVIVYAIIWLLGVVGFAIPPVIVKLLWAIVAIIALIMLVQLLLGGVSYPRRIL